MSDLVKPTIHLNGTSRTEMLGSYQDACSAISTAMRRVNATCPNGRDYYPQGNDVLARAIEQHVDRVVRLQSVLAELQEIAETIYD